MAGGFSLGSIFGKDSAFTQLFEWQVLAQVIGALDAPALEALTALVNSKVPIAPLTVADVVDAVVKGHIPEGQGAAEASLSGTSKERFRLLLDSAGEPPGAQFLVEAYRRGIIPLTGAGASSVSVEQGIRESRTKDKWVPVIERMGMVPIGVADAVDAVVEGQIDRAQGEQIAYVNGVSKEDFAILVNTRGNPPAPGELIELVRRGFIPMRGVGPDVTSLQQGIYEGATKDKWEPHFEQLVETLPPPRTVTALLRSGAITDEQAATLFRQSGLSQDMAHAYVEDAHHTKTAAAKELARGDVEALYRDQVISHQDATTMLEALGWTEHEAALLLELQDLRRAVRAVEQAVSRVKALYVAHKIDQAAAVGAMDALHLPHEQRDQLLADWGIERALNVKRLSAGEIASAFYYKIISQETAIAELQRDGYTPFDAWMLLSVRTHNPLPNMPPPGAGV